MNKNHNNILRKNNSKTISKEEFDELYKEFENCLYCNFSNRSSRCSYYKKEINECSKNCKVLTFCNNLRVLDDGFVIRSCAFIDTKNNPNWNATKNE